MAGEHTAERTDIGEHSRSERFTRQLANALFSGIRRVDIDSRVLVGDGHLFFKSGFPQIELPVASFRVRNHVDKIDGILARITCRAELTTLATDSAHQPRQAEVSKRIRFDVFTDFFHRVAGGNQLFLGRRIDAVKAWRQRRRTTDSHVYFFGACCTDHFYDLSACCSANDGIVDENHSLACQEFLYRIELHLYAKIANSGFRLDERPPDIVVTNQTECERDSRLLRVADRRSYTGIG